MLDDENGGSDSGVDNWWRYSVRAGSFVRAMPPKGEQGSTVHGDGACGISRGRRRNPDQASAVAILERGLHVCHRGNGNRIKYSVTGGGKTLSADLVWAFGFGSMGQTYLYEFRGALYESQLSFYSAVNGLDFTIGHRNPAQSNLELAAGRRVDKLEETRCFGCHTTGTSSGVRCERCHEGAQQHASGAGSKTPAKLSRLSNEELSEFCGACHRTWEDVQANGPHDINNVRFQPYRLATSKCYNASVGDKRIGCVGCHNPHEDVVKNAAYYNANCQGCHNAPTAKACKIAQKDCSTCHMPKVDFPGGHFQFTDHRIRIVRGTAYPG